LAGTFDGFVDLGDFRMGQFFPAGTYRGAITQAAEEDFDFGECEVHFRGETDEEHAIQGVNGVTPLAAYAVGCFENAHPFVIANRGWFEVRASGEFANLHSSLSRKGFDLKLTLSFNISTCW